LWSMCLSVARRRKSNACQLTVAIKDERA
jgi:hypothetical protein